MTYYHRSVWLSDIHLGCKDCKAELLLDFLQHHEMQTLYLVGDIIDFWAMKRQVNWPDSHTQVLKLLQQKARQGTRIIYLPGNHDENLKPYAGMTFENIEVHRRFIHKTAQGKQLLILHGDDFDAQVCCGKFEAWLGDKLYDFLLFLNRHLHRYRKRRGFHYWSLASYIKSRVKGAQAAMQRYRQAALSEAKSLQLDGVVCGHIHQPELDEQDGMIYCNDGDWVENCSALTESATGELELVFWTQTKHWAQLQDQAA